MRKRLLIGLVVLGICVLAGVLSFRETREGPSYQGKTISGWAYQLLAPGPEVREQAAAIFRSLGNKAVPGLITMLESRDPLWRRQLWALAGRLPPRLRHGLVRHSRVPQESAAHQAATMALTIIGPDAKAAVPALGRALASNEPENIWYVAEALGAVGKDSLPALTNALANTDPRIRSAAVFGLGRLGPAAEPAILPLLERLKDGNADVRERTIQALASIGPPAVAALVQALKDGSAEVRSSAAKTLGMIGPSAKAALPALARASEDGDVSVCAAAREALVEIKPGRGRTTSR